MNVRNIINQKSGPCISFELFPARDEKAAKRQAKAIDGMISLNPDFMSVTFGAGGSTRDGSYELVKTLKAFNGPDIVAYISAYGLNPADIEAVARAYVDLGIETLFCIAGDTPGDPDFVKDPDAFNYASEMIAFLTSRFDVCKGCAGYPEGHKDAVSLDTDIDAIKRKVDNGAEFIISQYFYDNRFFYQFREKCMKIGIKVPILAGIMPIYTLRMTENLAKTCAATITDELRKGLDTIDTTDNKAVAAFGMDFLAPKCQDLVENQVDGLHFYTMNKSKAVKQLLDAINKQES